jgi:hypothetical protein
MIWGAPIWVNEFIVYFIKLVINMIYLYIPVLVIYLAYKMFVFIAKWIKNKENVCSMGASKAIVFLIFSLLVSFAILITFNYSQQVIPDKYTFDSFTINRSGGIAIRDKEKLVELKKILNEYTCKRSLDEGIEYQLSEVIELNVILLDNKDHVQTMHIIIADKQHMRYTGGNTDFFYIIEDNDQELHTKMMQFINSL